VRTAARDRASRRRALRAAWLVAVLATPRAQGAVPPARASDDTTMTVTIVSGDDRCAPRLRALLAEQLVGVASDLAWSCRSRFDPDEPFQPALPGRTRAVRIWVDVSSPEEARLTWGDQRVERFLLRRLPLAHGLDEVGREEIAQVVRAASLAFLEGAAETLTPAQARVAVASWEAPAAHARAAPPGEPSPAPARGPPARVVLGPSWSVRAFSREIPVVQELALSVVATPRGWWLSAWTEAGYRLRATYRAQPVGLELGAAAWRAGLTLAPRAVDLSRPSLSWRASAGLGVERVWFGSLDAAPTFESARTRPFFAVLARVLLGVEARPLQHTVITLDLFCDLPTSEVHYDYRSDDGAAHRLLTAFALAPGISLGVGWRP